MRFLLALIGLAAVIVVVLLSVGWLTLSTKPGSLPHVAVSGGSAPVLEANVATVTVGTKDKRVDVPTVTTVEKTISVPTVSMQKPADPDNAAAR